MKTKTLLLFTAALLMSMQSQAQFWKKVADRAAKSAEETVLNKVDEKTSRKTGKTMDTIFDSGNKSKKKNPTKKQPGTTQENKGNTDNDNGRNVKSAKDFVPGSKVLYADNFSNDAIGDFPITWNTNASAEVVTFEGEDTRWLQMANSGQFIPEAIKDIPENATLEFDLYVEDSYDYYSNGLYINISELSDRTQIFKNSKNRVQFWLHPASTSAASGRTHITTYIDGSKIIDNGITFNKFTRSKNSVHISIWRQKTRIRVYIDDSKIWDLPRAFGEANYNSMTFQTGISRGKVDAHFYIANLRLAIAGEDKRHALLETGEFETNEILFDTGKASIQASSSRILNEIGEVLQKNPKLKINIIGHTDSDGQEATNQLLSEARAKSVKEYLTDNFPIMGNRLSTMGKGASMPVASNDSDDGKRKNRRVQFIKLE